METCSFLPFKEQIENSYTKTYNISYGQDKEHTLDLFFPDNYKKKTPIVILIHGGAWCFGEKEALHHLQEFLANNNIISANINYRLVKNGITYKDQLEDIHQAIAFLKDKTDSLNLASRFILFGESAGGHLSLLYGYKNPAFVEKIISLAAPTDFFSKDYTKNKLYHWYTRFFFELATGERYTQKDSIPKAFKEASPIANTSNVPTLILQGTRDIIVDQSQALSLDSVLTKKAIPHKLVLMDGAIHIARRLPWWRDKVIYPEILQFVNENYISEQLLTKKN